MGGIWCEHEYKDVSLARTFQFILKMDLKVIFILAVVLCAWSFTEAKPVQDFVSDSSRKDTGSPNFIMKFKQRRYPIGRVKRDADSDRNSIFQEDHEAYESKTSRPFIQRPIYNLPKSDGTFKTYYV